MPLYNPASSAEAPLPGVPAEFVAAVDEGDSSTTSTTYQTKLVLTTPTLVGGTYALWWYMRNTTSGANKDFQLQVLDGATQEAYYRARYAQAASEQPFSGVLVQTIAPGTVKNYYLQYARISNTTLTVNSARFLFWRVS